MGRIYLNKSSQTIEVSNKIICVVLFNCCKNIGILSAFLKEIELFTHSIKKKQTNIVLYLRVENQEISILDFIRAEKSVLLTLNCLTIFERRQCFLQPALIRFKLVIIRKDI